MRSAGRGCLVAGLFLAMSWGWAGVVPVAEASHVCDPSPIGRCGAYHREAVVFCYAAEKPKGVYESPTDPHVVTLGPGNPLHGMGIPAPGGPLPNVASQDSAAMGLLYLRKTPTDDLVADPWNAPFPFDSVHLEDNAVAGLQLEPFFCANFLWFDECEPAQWMNFNPVGKDPDEVLA